MYRVIKLSRKLRFDQICQSIFCDIRSLLTSNRVLIRLSAVHPSKGICQAAQYLVRRVFLDFWHDLAQVVVTATTSLLESLLNL